MHEKINQLSVKLTAHYSEFIDEYKQAQSGYILFATIAFRALSSRTVLNYSTLLMMYCLVIIKAFR